MKTSVSHTAEDNSERPARTELVNDYHNNKMAGKDGVQSDNEEEIQDAPQAKKPAKHDSVGAADLEKVTDYAEEMEISSQGIGDVSKTRPAFGHFLVSFSVSYRMLPCAAHAFYVHLYTVHSETAV
jgi:hypothetical protein